MLLNNFQMYIINHLTEPNFPRRKPGPDHLQWYVFNQGEIKGWASLGRIGLDLGCVYHSSKTQKIQLDLESC